MCIDAKFFLNFRFSSTYENCQKNWIFASIHNFYWSKGEFLLCSCFRCNKQNFKTKIPKRYWQGSKSGLGNRIIRGILEKFFPWNYLILKFSLPQTWLGGAVAKQRLRGHKVAGSPTINCKSVTWAARAWTKPSPKTHDIVLVFKGDRHS